MDQVVILKTDSKGTVHQAIMPYGYASDGREVCRVIDTKSGSIITTRERNPREADVVKAYADKKVPLVYYSRDREIFELKRSLTSSEENALKELEAEGHKNVVFLVAAQRLDDTHFSHSAPTAAASGWGRRHLSRTPSLSWQG